MKAFDREKRLTNKPKTLIKYMTPKEKAKVIEKMVLEGSVEQK